MDHGRNLRIIIIVCSNWIKWPVVSLLCHHVVKLLFSRFRCDKKLIFLLGKKLALSSEIFYRFKNIRRTECKLVFLSHLRHRQKIFRLDKFAKVDENQFLRCFERKFPLKDIFPIRVLVLHVFYSKKYLKLLYQFVKKLRIIHLISTTIYYAFRMIIV